MKISEVLRAEILHKYGYSDYNCSDLDWDELITNILEKYGIDFETGINI